MNIDVTELTLPGAWQPDRTVNVASVPQRSPFRYPGGKTWFVPYFRAWHNSLPKASILFEPFAGGGVIGLTAAFEQLAGQTQMSELDRSVAAVWQTILSDEVPWLADRIANFKLTAESVHRVVGTTPESRRELAFQTIVRNRVNRGGILARGAGQLRAGENGKGLNSRWYPETLKRRILDIYAIRERIAFVEGDGLEILRQNADQADAIFFIDPPYTASGKKAGSRLYDCHEFDHQGLFTLASNLKGAFVMTYDDTPEIRELAVRYNFEVQPISMKNTHHAKMTELVIGRQLIKTVSG